MRPKLLHLFNAFEVGGVERQHMMLLERLAPDFDQTCWSYCHGPLEDALHALNVPYEVGGAAVVDRMLKTAPYDCVVMRTNRYLDDLLQTLGSCETPVVYIKDYLRWFDGNGTYLDAERDALAATMAHEAFYCGPSLAPGLRAFPPERGQAHLMYNGLDFKRFPMRPRSLEAAGCLRIGMVANITRRKNQLWGIEALRDELGRGAVRLELAGAFQEPDYVEALRRAGAGLPVTLHGYVADPIGFLEGVDALLMTSTLEGWPVALMEAMACGVPVIAPDVGDVSALLDAGRAGLLYNVGDAGGLREQIATLRATGRYAQLSRQGLRKVLEFDISRSHQQLRSAIRRTMSKGTLHQETKPAE